MNVLAKLAALPVKIINIVCKGLLFLAPITRIAGFLLLLVVLVMHFLQYIFPLIIGMKDDISPDWRYIISSLAIPAVIMFAELPFLLLDSLTNSLFNWLWNGEHRSTRSQINDYICEKKYNDLKNSSRNAEETDKEIQEIAAKLRDLHNQKGG